MMVKFGRTNHLSHPLCETLLRQKWLSYGFPIYMLNLFFYLVFLLIFSYFVVTFPSCNHHDPSTYNIHRESASSACPNRDFESFDQSATGVQVFCVWFLVLYCFLNFILEVIQFSQDGWDYFSDIENYIQWTLYITTSVFTVPFLFNQSWHYQWVAGSIGICAAYFALLFLLGRFDIYGIYVIMFLEILKTLLQVLSLFSILIIGFALTFCIARPFSQVIKIERERYSWSKYEVIALFCDRLLFHRIPGISSWSSWSQWWWCWVSWTTSTRTSRMRMISTSRMWICLFCWCLPWSCRSCWWTCWSVWRSVIWCRSSRMLGWNGWLCRSVAVLKCMFLRVWIVFILF